jgi:hypothetical protein
MVYFAVTARRSTSCGVGAGALYGRGEVAVKQQVACFVAKVDRW